MNEPLVKDDTATPMDAASLAQAFQAFARASDELTNAYSGLQDQVASLTDRLRLLLATLPAGVLIVDRDGTVEQINKAARAMLGEEVAGRTWAEVAQVCLAPTDMPGEWSWQPLQGECAVERVSISQSEVEQSGGRLILLHDSTEAYRMRQQVARTERLASMGEMVAGLAHQLRTPLAAALLYTGHLASMDLPPANRADVAQRSLERLRHLERLITDMLMFARGEALGREAFGICELVGELAHTIEPVASRQSAQFTTDCLAGSETLFGNRKELAGALLNLLENALNAVGSKAPDGAVMLTASVSEGQARFIVRDNGRGIPPALQARLFEPFFTTRAEGTGLGLAIARGVARAHGGDIALQSEPGVGTEFTFSIPLAPATNGANA
ncbi:sensor histidine kinase [Uliginosibacterium sp. H1]|uniref:sensor histidine kinase n=1 Tax=Uliginosibacterium sp. H1 TaxID=3114757 RepID=UPI002E17680B|nr:ATP-binding protein [Uliginosibacterium sp. H1]